ncbi:MAG: 3-methylornithyl-N6-L-lysine dehydrogenase PylD [Candidatus Methanomethylophilaceae archaeon]
MTRLTTDMIQDTVNVSQLDYKLVHSIGMDTLGLAKKAAGTSATDTNPRKYSAAVVPMTCGLGTISGFSESVDATLKNLGMRSSITSGTDVVGMTEAIESDADIVFMADDEQFIALNVRMHKYVDNTESTARGYVAALEAANGSLQDKTVLVIGCGRVGSIAIGLLSDLCARVCAVDICYEKAMQLREVHCGLQIYSDTETAVRENRLIVNCSPAPIPGEWIMEGSVISSPGVPYSFDREGERKAKIIHDPLSIGVSVMAVMSMSLSQDSDARMEEIVFAGEGTDEKAM